MELSPAEIERYSRHFSLPDVGREGQLKLRRARVLIIGAGGLGSPVALYLAAAGVGHLTIMDQDRVNLSNLQRQVLYSTQDVGASKSSRAQTRLTELNPEIQIDSMDVAFSEVNGAKLIQEHDLVIDGTDNFETRYLVNDLCVQEKKAFVFGAIYRFDAQVSVFNYQGGPCYRCLYPTAPPLEAVSNCTEAGVLGVLPGTVGTLMATEALKIILQIGEILKSQVLVYDSLRAETYKRKLQIRKGCFCQGGEIAESPCTNCRIEALEWNQIDRLDDFVVIDVRSKNEFNEAHLASAKNLPLTCLKDSVGQISPDQKILLVCKSGKRSARAGEILSGLGYQHLHQLKGGMDQIQGREAHAAKN